MKTILDHALNYLSQGIAVIPSNPKTKAPLVKWVEFQQRLPTKEEVISMFNQFPKCMISCVTGRISNLIVIDADSEEAVKKIEGLLPDSFETIIDVSPRGGRHYWFQMNGAEYQSKTGIFEKCDIKCNGGVLCIPPSVNDTGGQYRFLYHLEFKRELLHPMPESLFALLKQHIDNPKKTSESNEELKKLWSGTSEGGRNQSLTRLVGSWVKLGLSKEECLFNSNLWNTKNKPPLTESEILSVINSVCNTDARNNRNLAEEVREWVSMLVGCEFLVRDCYNELEAVSKQQKGAVRTELHNMFKKGIIEKDKINGKYRKPNMDEEIIDFVNVTTSCLDIKFPFQIENYVRIMPKNIIVIAGEPDAGKTAFLLNLVRMNMNNNEIFYFSSEMGALEMQDRLRNFDHPIDAWKFTPIERSNDFADVIRPNAVNIIDFLEISDNFYQVSGLIKAIYDKLDKGITIIALQKNKGTDYGLGGMRSLEKPRLYLSMEPGKLKIVKAKNWVSADKNPNRLSITYKLYKGCHFTPISGWLKPIE